MSKNEHVTTRFETINGFWNALTALERSVGSGGVRINYEERRITYPAGSNADRILQRYLGGCNPC